MKTLSTLCVSLLCFALSSSAQPTISTADMLLIGPISGSELIFQAANIGASDFETLEEAEGEDQLWDFNEIEEITVTAEIASTTIECDAVPEAAQIDACDLIYKLSVGSFVNNHAVAEYVDPNLIQRGSVNNSSGTVQVNECNPGRIIYAFPLIYEAWDSTQYVCGPIELGSGFQTEEAGSRVTEVEAWGSLILPGFNFSTILRYKTIEEGIFTNYFDGSMLVSNNFKRTSYEFITPGYAFPVARIIKNELDANPPNYSAEYMIKGFPSGLNDAEATAPSWAVYPNPLAGEILNLSYANANSYQTEISLYSLDGRMIYVEILNLSSSSGQRTINLPAIASGMYYLNIKNDDGARSLMVQLE